MRFDSNYFRRRGNFYPWIKAIFYTLLVKVFFWPKTLLDVGCAKGEFVLGSHHAGIKSYGIDISNKAIQQVPSRIRNYCRVGNILKIPFKKNSFDLVTSFALLEHIPAQMARQAVSELMRVSKRYVLVQICDKDSPQELSKNYRKDPTHVNVATTSWWKRQFDQWQIDYKEILPKMGLFLLVV
ncbi:MAG: hypothetical protein DRH56_04665 [Deltaproteobacteria bacterium]|nr:MAG: hypothetical protein DRH56_04665 [Deltaproteobacteria bacterium]